MTMTNMLSRASQVVTPENEKLSKYNLKENPFPENPFVNHENSDRRYNGDIYESMIREAEYLQIENNFLKVSQSDPNHIRIGYILDTSYVGRGNGKSSFAINLLKKINNQFCFDLTLGKNKCFGLYITPAPSGRTRNFSNFLDLIADTIFNSCFIRYSISSLRLEAIIKLKLADIPEKELENEDQLMDDLNSIDWFDKKNILLSDIHDYLNKNSYFNLITAEFPLKKRTWSSFQKNLSITTEQDFINYYGKLKKDSDKINFIFNDLVNLFLASGFNGSYLIVDDFERIPDFQSDRQKRDFAMELRTNFFDGSTANAKIGFYNLILLLHAGVPRLVEKAWSDSGMDQRSPINSVTQSDKHIVLFNKLSSAHAILLVKKYLTEYRINPADNLA